MSTVTSEMPEKLLQFLSQGTPVLLATYGADGWPSIVMTWAAARDARTVRFGADVGSATQANLEREGRATLQVIGPDNILFLIKGEVRQVKDQIEAAPFPIAMVELTTTEVKDQSWPGVVVAPLTYQWVGEQSEAMAAMEQAVLAELREWEP
jgi:predicted pyridoxine 5'-phosphate oxidase superfamily flavin-nucleotide-binding protein